MSAARAGQVESGLPSQPSFLEKLKQTQRLNEDLLESDAQVVGPP